MLLMLSWLIALTPPGLCLGREETNRMSGLPGLPEGSSIEQYSGYLRASASNRLFYWLIVSENQPSTDPVVLWMNGGPGCSSMLGLLTENGPFQIRNDGGLEMNPWSWNKKANVLYVDVQACVGFSYSTSADTCVYDDDLTVKELHRALRHFFEEYPVFDGNAFYVTGESYAGVYIALLATLLLDDPAIPFRGFAVGNGITNDDLTESGLVHFQFGHGLISSKLFNDIATACCPDANATNCMFFESNVPDCEILRREVGRVRSGSGLNIYDIYKECAHDREVVGLDGLEESDGTYRRRSSDKQEVALSREGREHSGKTSSGPGKSDTRGTRKAIPCTDSGLLHGYLNQAGVRQALHVHHSVTSWEGCRNSEMFIYTEQYRDMTSHYEKVLLAGKRIMVYYGDTDMACNFIGGKLFIDKIGSKRLQLRPYGSWTYESQDGTNQVAGFVQVWTNLTYVTVKGAGHMLPTDAPKRAFLIFNKFLEDGTFD